MTKNLADQLNQMRDQRIAAEHRAADAAAAEMIRQQIAQARLNDLRKALVSR